MGRYEARPIVAAALMRAEKSLSETEPVSNPETTSSSGNKGTTKKEPVALPKFQGEEKPGGGSPFLEFPVWLRNWNKHIGDYKEKSRSNMLLSHLDKDAQRRIIGSENNYSIAMKKLEAYFGDKRKVIRDCTSEIANFSKVQQNDFRNLVALKTCIEINYARLASLELQTEMSNSISMKILETKFPPVQQVEWARYLNGLSVERQVNVFPEFLNWLDVEGEVWAAMESKGSTSAVQAKANTKPATTL